MVYRASVIGIDGAGKSTTISDTVSNLSTDYRVAKLGRPIYIEEDRNRGYMFGSTTGFIDMLHSTFDRFSSKTAVLLVNGLNVAVQQNLERRVIEQWSPDIVISSRDMTVCPSVYITYYFPSSKKISTELRIRIFESFRKLGYPDQLFYLDVDPKTADERITERMCREHDAPATERAKWRHMHEDTEHLSELRKYYLEAVSIIENKGINVMSISTIGRSRREVAAEMEHSLRQSLRREPSSILCHH
jgi:thymidylate kinase